MKRLTIILLLALGACGDNETPPQLEWRCSCPGYPSGDDLLTCGADADEALDNVAAVNCPDGWTCVEGDYPDWSCEYEEE